MKELLEAGVHFGHQTKRWNPKMQKYIFGERNGIYIIDLQKTLKKFREAYAAVRELAAGGGTMLFNGTKKQAQDTVFDESSRCVSSPPASPTRSWRDGERSPRTRQRRAPSPRRWPTSSWRRPRRRRSGWRRARNTSRNSVTARVPGSWTARRPCRRARVIWRA